MLQEAARQRDRLWELLAERLRQQQASGELDGDEAQLREGPPDFERLPLLSNALTNGVRVQVRRCARCLLPAACCLPAAAVVLCTLAIWPALAAGALRLPTSCTSSCVLYCPCSRPGRSHHLPCDCPDPDGRTHATSLAR